MELVFLIVMGFVAFLAAERRFGPTWRSRQVRPWREAAEAAGLTQVAWETSMWSSAILTGRAGAQCVRLETYKVSKYETGIRITVEGDSGITLRRETLGTTAEKAMGAREIEIGDEEFDHEVYVHGVPDVLWAVLDAETRRAVRELLRGQVRVGDSADRFLEADVAIRDGDLQAEFREASTLSLQAHLRGVLATLLAVARYLERPARIVERLAENFGQEPVPGVRLRNLLLLASNHRRHPATRMALVRGCEDEREEVQLEAALALGGEVGHATLIEIASREWADDIHAARAIDALGRSLPFERGPAILAHALRTRRRRTARACLEVLGHLGDPAAVEPLAKVLAVETGELAMTAARALGLSGLAAAEGPLLEALGRAAGEVRVAVAEALGRVGSAAAVLPLKEAAERDGGLRRAARQAVAEIQSRLSGASPGQLSLAEGDAGRLSLADEDPRGRVSMADPGRSE